MEGIDALIPESPQIGRAEGHGCEGLGSGTFETLEEAGAHMDEYVAWYNGNHKHSGIALFSPNEVHDGSWREAWQRRDAVQQAYYDAHPERFRNRPRTPAPAGLVGINQPKPQPQPQPA